jgi:hypothetical protein
MKGTLNLVSEGREGGTWRRASVILRGSVSVILDLLLDERFRIAMNNPSPTREKLSDEPLAVP